MNTSVTILNGNGLTIPSKTQRLSDWIKRRTKANLMQLQEVFKNTERLKGNGLEKTDHVNTPQGQRTL